MLCRRRDQVRKLAVLTDAVIGLSMMKLSAVSSEYDFVSAWPVWPLSSTGKVRGRPDNCGGSASRTAPPKNQIHQNAKFIHIDIDAAEIDKNIPAISTSLGCREILKRITAKLSPTQRPEWKKEVAKMIEDEIFFYPKGQEMHPKAIIERVQRHTSDDTVIVTDVGQHQMWCAQYYRFRKPRTLLTSGGLGTMAWSAAALWMLCAGGEMTVLFTIREFRHEPHRAGDRGFNNLPIVIIL